MTGTQLSLAYALDILVGDPGWFPHPVRGFGYLIRHGEKWLRKLDGGPSYELIAGGALACSVTAVAWSLGAGANDMVQVVLAWSALATRSLVDEARAVIQALESGDLVLARRRLSRIVGRDTAHLAESEIARAVIESLAESACDGIVAPLFWLGIGGLPAAMAYKAINTLDSMIGHREAPYTYFGRIAARLDDTANYVPARLTAAGIIAAAKLQGLSASRALEIWLRDGDKHASPNAGQSEAAMAGALGVRLGGINSYDGQPHAAPELHPAGHRPSSDDARAAVSTVVVVSALTFGAVLLFLSWRRRAR